MTSKPKSDVKVLKGQDGTSECIYRRTTYNQISIAEDAILTYIKRVTPFVIISHIELIRFQMNRPFGAVDVAANLKGAVPKTATQKILVALAEKGELTQKLYGKSRPERHRSVSPDSFLLSISFRENHLFRCESNKNRGCLFRKAGHPRS